jgi:hypothetical protein
MADLLASVSDCQIGLKARSVPLSNFGGVPKAIVCDNMKDGGVCKKSYIDNRKKLH